MDLFHLIHSYIFIVESTLKFLQISYLTIVKSRYLSIFFFICIIQGILPCPLLSIHFHLAKRDIKSMVVFLMCIK